MSLATGNMHSKLLALFNKITRLEDDEIELIKESFHPLYLARGGFFLETGKINRHIGFLSKGLVRYFVYKDGEESTFEFTKEGEFIGDYQSFNNRSASIQSIQAIEACEILTISFSDVQAIFNTTRHGNLIGRNDLLIAAHALAAELTLVTANTREFARVPSLGVENWLLE